MITDLPASLTVPLSKRKKRGHRPTTRSSDALTLSSSNLEAVRELFSQFAVARANGNQELANNICHALLSHTQVEEICYPAALEI